VAIPINTHVIVLLVGGEIVEGDVAMADQATYLCLRRDNETWYLPWTAIKCVKGPALPERGITGNYPRTATSSGGTASPAGSPQGGTPPAGNSPG